MHQYFSNSPGELYEDAVHALKVLGATESLRLLERAAELLFDGGPVPKDQEERFDAMKAYPEDESDPAPDWAEELERIAGEFCEHRDGLHDKLREFAGKKGLLAPFEKGS